MNTMFQNQEYNSENEQGQQPQKWTENIWLYIALVLLIGYGIYKGSKERNQILVSVSDVAKMLT